MTNADLDLCPGELSICRSRGDTFPWTFTVKDAAGAPVDITGFSFLLTVDPVPDPTTNVNNLFQLSGTITNAPGGVVQFSLSTLQANQNPNDYFYDVQMTDGAGKIRTIARGTFTFEQDITK